ncbi:TIGR02301 family protein [Caulobacter sp. DWR2-3-1b2]|uniref:TIGR02301 family protein n=1 Tax=unclassified Caulobacter TaxID=2648921 RepID=UPI0019B334E4|nr:TIGR02301 family protein [Caulobacter sp.]
MNRPLISALLALAMLAPEGAVLAQDRGAVERQRLLDLAFTIGESHALRQVCEGVGDQYWRSRMMRLTQVEKADQAFDAQLRDKFNTGFAARQGQFVECDDASRQAEHTVARKGQALSTRLAQSMRNASASAPAPDSVADDGAAR